VKALVQPDHPADLVQKDGNLIIVTLEGDFTVVPGAWVVRGIQGEPYAVQHDIFLKSYEIFDDDTAEWLSADGWLEERA
jgi:hypothetical protein